jgi:hypothetical protein
MAARRLTEAQRRAMAEDRAEVAARAVLAAQEEAAAWARRFDRLLEVLGPHEVTVAVGEVDPTAEIAEARERELEAVAADLKKVQVENDRLAAAIRWALGEVGEFPPEPDVEPGKPRRRYWWRSELRRRAGLDVGYVEDMAPKSRDNLAESKP